MLVNMPSSQLPLAGLTLPKTSEMFSTDLGKTLINFMLVELPDCELSAETTVFSAAVFPVAGFPATITAADRNIIILLCKILLY